MEESTRKECDAPFCFLGYVFFSEYTEAKGYHPLMAGIYLNSGIIFNIATRASEEAPAGESVLRNAVTAIIFSVVFLEAVINECAEIASDIDPRGEKEPQKIQAFAEIMKLTEESRGSLELKYQLAGWVLGGQCF